jgi:endonuclease/exonuclease/phosphatase family metal-dependent hydrolase
MTVSVSPRLSQLAARGPSLNGIAFMERQACFDGKHAARRAIRPGACAPGRTTRMRNLEVDLLKVLTLNVHKGFSLRRRFVLHELRDAIRRVSADVVFLQEVVGDHLELSTKHDKWPQQAQYEFLADTIWKSFAYGQNAVYPEGHHGNALLSKLPIIRHQNTHVSGAAGERRGLLHAVLKVPRPSKVLHAICVHLGLGERSRNEQAGRLCDLVDTEVPENEPLIIAGDFNDWRGRTHARLSGFGLREVFCEATGSTARTFPALWPILKLDRIYVRHLCAREPTVLRQKPWSRLSDHAALTVELESDA